MHISKMIFISVILLSLSTASYAGVLGACNSGDEKISPSDRKSAQKKDAEVMSVPLPGQAATDFELTAVVQNKIKTVKLSDYSGKYRVLCFFPAAFTFV
jgi:hypothetical protein